MTMNTLIRLSSRLNDNSIQRDALQQLSAALSDSGRYLPVINLVFKDQPLACFTQLYGQMFLEACQQPQWFAEHLVEQLNEAIAQAKLFWSLGEKTSDEAIIGKFKDVTQGLLDEARHYLQLIKVVFPGALDGETSEAFGVLIATAESELSQNVSSHRASQSNQVLDCLLQQNLMFARLYTRARLTLPASVSNAPEEDFDQVSAQVASICENKLRLFTLTAQVIDTFLVGIASRKQLLRVKSGVRKVISATSEQSVDFHYNLRFGNYP